MVDKTRSFLYNEDYPETWGMPPTTIKEKFDKLLTDSLKKKEFNHQGPKMGQIVNPEYRSKRKRIRTTI